MSRPDVDKIFSQLNNITNYPWGVTHYAGGFNFNGPPSVYQLGSDNGYGEPILIARCNHEKDVEFIAKSPEYICDLINYIKELEQTVANITKIISTPNTFCEFEELK